ncbi:MAG: hypothetical protein PWQ29_881 [Verrucomicrobiota bacterium]|jgi:hypothetical protein|nr:hypothetical protein [Verrucomicrobiota bacterium]MDK2963487.1 hypothetical protein [Verrucomicrobiota bacterium]
MSELSVATILIGLLALAAGGISILAPARVQRGLTAFPRSVWPGRILAAVDLVWAAYGLTLLHLGMMDAWKVHLYWLTPVAIFLCIKYLDELLSPRALGGFLLLAAGPVLDAARWNPSGWRLIVTVIAYLWIGFGLLLLLSPWWFRRIVLLATKNRSALRVGGAVKLFAGIGLLLLALLVY